MPSHGTLSRGGTLRMSVQIPVNSEKQDKAMTEKASCLSTTVAL